MFHKLNAIVDVDASARAGWRAIDVARALLDGGARFIQVRAKTFASAEFLELASAVVAAAKPFDAIVLINDRGDIAKLSGAHGVHVGQDDLPPDAVRSILGPSAIVGVSTHTMEEMTRAALQPVDYIAIGPVFETTTKETGYHVVGLDAVRQAAAFGKPVVAIGGITVDTAASVIDAGAASVAIIGDLFATNDPAGRVRELSRVLGL